MKSVYILIALLAVSAVAEKSFLGSEAPYAHQNQYLNPKVKNPYVIDNCEWQIVTNIRKNTKILITERFIKDENSHKIRVQILPFWKTGMQNSCEEQMETVIYEWVKTNLTAPNKSIVPYEYRRRIEENQLIDLAKNTTTEKVIEYDVLDGVYKFHWTKRVVDKSHDHICQKWAISYFDKNKNVVRKHNHVFCHYHIKKCYTPLNTTLGSVIHLRTDEWCKDRECKLDDPPQIYETELICWRTPDMKKTPANNKVISEWIYCRLRFKNISFWQNGQEKKRWKQRLELHIKDVRYQPTEFSPNNNYPSKKYTQFTVPNLVGTPMYKLVKKGMGYTDFELYMFFPLRKANIYAFAEIDDQHIAAFEWNNDKKGDDLITITPKSAGIWSKKRFKFPMTVQFQARLRHKNAQLSFVYSKSKSWNPADHKNSGFTVTLHAAGGPDAFTFRHNLWSESGMSAINGKCNNKKMTVQELKWSSIAIQLFLNGQVSVWVNQHMVCGTDYNTQIIKDHIYPEGYVGFQQPCYKYNSYTCGTYEIKQFLMKDKEFMQKMEDNALGSKAINWANNKPDYRGSK